MASNFEAAREPGDARSPGGIPPAPARPGNGREHWIRRAADAKSIALAVMVPGRAGLLVGRARLRGRHA